jgi:NAD(P)-dependent dehydrogenase (short-subunit alcohol dehydrogenase family)
MDVTGKTAVITGVSRGLGLGMARRFAERGVKVAGCARSDRAADDGCAYFENVDVADAEALEAFVANAARELGGIDLFINNAAVLGPVDPARDVTPHQLRAHLDVNVVGAFVGGRAFARHLRDADRRGVLINVSSGAALKGYAGWVAYCAGKAAVDRITEVMQLEESDRLRAFSIAPGVIDTDMQKKIRETPEARFPSRERFLQLKRDDAFNSETYVADAFLDVAFDQQARDEVVLRLPPEPRDA